MFKRAGSAVRGEGNWLPVVSDFQRSVFNPIPISNQMTDTFLRPNTSWITSGRIWDDPPPFMSWIRPEWGDGNADRATRHQRRKVREAMTNAYIEQFRQELSQRSMEEQREFGRNRHATNRMLEKFAADAVQKQMTRMYRRRPNETSEEFFNRINLREERRLWRNGEHRLDFSLRDMEAGLGYRDIDRRRRENQR